MILKLTLTLFFIFCMLYLIRKKLLNVDLSFPWFLAIIILTIASTSPEFIQPVANMLGIKYPPLVVIMLTLFIILALVTILGIYITELRRRQILIIRKLALQELLNQKQAVLDKSDK